MRKRTLAILLMLMATGCTSDDDDGGAGGEGGSGSGGSATGGGGADAGGTAGGDAGAGASGATDAGGDAPMGPPPGKECDAMPSNGLLAVFKVVDTEYFRVSITDSAAITQAIDLWQGNSSANIPNGALICEPADYNCGYSWHLDPADIHFADVTIEVCDGTPSYIEEHCADFGERYCTWAAELIELRDCREVNCPLIPRTLGDAG